MLTVIEGKENVGVAVMVGVNVIVGVSVMVEVNVASGVAVNSGVFVKTGVDVEVGGSGVAVGICDGSPQARMANTIKR